MPAKSISQQQAAGSALSAKRGKIPVSSLQGASKSMYDSMSEDELEKFASTKHTGLPDKVESAIANANTIAETIRGLSEDRKSDYKKFFKSAIEKFGYKSVKNMPSDIRAKFFTYVDDNWKSLEETSSSAGVPGYLTPNAFTGGEDAGKKKRDHIATQLGYKIVGTEQIKEYEDSVSAIKSGPMGFQDPDKEESEEDEKSENIIRELLKKEISKILDEISMEDLNESLDVNLGPDRNLSPKQQLGHSIREIRNHLTEVEKLVNKSLKMKNESGIKYENYGKRAYKALSKIDEKVNKLMTSLQYFK